MFIDELPNRPNRPERDGLRKDVRLHLFTLLFVQHPAVLRLGLMLDLDTFDRAIIHSCIRPSPPLHHFEFSFTHPFYHRSIPRFTSILGDSAPHDLRQMPTFNVSAGNRVSLL